MNLAGTGELQWKDLQPGQKIRLADANGERHTGVVEERTENGEFVWVLTVGDGRKLLHVADGFDVAEW